MKVSTKIFQIHFTKCVQFIVLMHLAGCYELHTRLSSFFVLVVFFLSLSSSFVSHIEKMFWKRKVETIDVIWLTREPFSPLSLYNAFAKRNASNYCQMYMHDAYFFALETRKTAQIRLCTRIFRFNHFFLLQAPVQIGRISFV